MSKVLGWVKTHPLAAGSILAGGVVLLIIVLFSGGKSAPASVAVTAQPMSDTGQTTALQVAQLQAGISAQAISSQATTDQANIAAARDVALKNSDVSLANVYAQADTAKTVATLGAQVANNQTEASKEINAAQVSAATQIAQIQALAQTQIAQMGADNNRYAIEQNSVIAQAGYASANIVAQQNSIAAQQGYAAQNYQVMLETLSNNYIAQQQGFVAQGQTAADVIKNQQDNLTKGAEIAGFNFAIANALGQFNTPVAQQAIAGLATSR